MLSFSALQLHPSHCLRIHILCALCAHSLPTLLPYEFAVYLTSACALEQLIKLFLTQASKGLGWITIFLVSAQLLEEGGSLLVSDSMFAGSG